MQLVAFVLGLSVGSFLNSVIYRLEQGGSVVSQRSRCVQCKHPLAWYDLIPVLSFVLLRGKCRYCKQKISWQYPLVEISTGLIFLLIFNFQFLIFNEFSISQFLNLLYLWTVTSFLIVIFVHDFRHYIIPDVILYPAIIGVSAWRIFEFWSLNHWNLIGNWKLEIGNFEPLLYVVTSAILASAFFFAIYAFSRGRWMGFGDVKLAFFMGLFLGWPSILIALFSAFFLGALVGIFLVLSRKKEWKSQVPFGPFLITGTFVALFFGRALTEWYLNLVLI